MPTDGSRARPRGAILFDVDGTLVDTNYLHVISWLRTFRRFGHPEVEMAAVHRLIGLGSEDLVAQSIGCEPDQIPDGMLDAHKDEYAALHPEIRAFPRAAE